MRGMSSAAQMALAGEIILELERRDLLPEYVDLRTQPLCLRTLPPDAKMH